MNGKGRLRGGARQDDGELSAAPPVGPPRPHRSTLSFIPHPSSFRSSLCPPCLGGAVRPWMLRITIAALLLLAVLLVVRAPAGEDGQAAVANAPFGPVVQSLLSGLPAADSVLVGAGDIAICGSPWWE